MGENERCLTVPMLMKIQEHRTLIYQWVIGPKFLNRNSAFCGTFNGTNILNFGNFMHESTP